MVFDPLALWIHVMSFCAQIEHFAKSIKYGAILGGSEEIMVDFGARQAVKAFPKSAKL